MRTLADLIRDEAQIAARPRQMERLEAIAAEIDRIGLDIACALEATYFDRPYDTRITAIRDVLHEATNRLRTT